MADEDEDKKEEEEEEDSEEGLRKAREWDEFKDGESDVHCCEHVTCYKPNCNYYGVTVRLTNQVD